MKKFELTTALSERRDEVISKHATTTDGTAYMALV